jgi:hypothetical protein
MRNALQRARTREVSYLELEEAAHGFAKVEDEQAWYDALVGFLERHNPPGGAPASLGSPREEAAQSAPPSETSSS